MLHTLSVVLSASLLAAMLVFVVETLLREQARIVAALSMVPQPERVSGARITRVRYAAGLRPALVPAMRPAPMTLREAA